MKINKILIFVSVFSILILPQVTFADWWNPSTWGKKTPVTQTTNQQTAKQIKSPITPISPASSTPQIIVKNVSDPSQLAEINNLKAQIVKLQKENASTTLALQKAQDASSKFFAESYTCDLSEHDLITKNKDLVAVNTSLTETNKKWLSVYEDWKKVDDMKTNLITMCKSMIGTQSTSIPTPARIPYCTVVTDYLNSGQSVSTLNCI